MKVLKMGCLICMLLFAILAIYSWFSVVDSTEKQIPFEVVTKMGSVSLHLGMPKDSVILLIGKPDNYESYSLGNRIIEEIGYKINSKSYADLTFRFENGELESFRQN